MSRVFTKATTGIASQDKYHPFLRQHRETLHYGLPVLTDERQLLVHWSELK